MAVTFNKNLIKQRITKARDKALPILAQQVLKDSNFYARMDSGVLIASSLKSSDFDKGILIWDTPYASKVYHTGFPSKDVNVNASLMWFEVAKSKHLKRWVALARKEILKGV